MQKGQYYGFFDKPPFYELEGRTDLSTVPMQEFRCTKCGKLFGMVDGKSETKCTRCEFITAIKLTREKLAAKALRDSPSTK
jgi:phage FluMu protein Com